MESHRRVELSATVRVCQMCNQRSNTKVSKIKVEAAVPPPTDSPTWGTSLTTTAGLFYLPTSVSVTAAEINNANSLIRLKATKGIWANMKKVSHAPTLTFRTKCIFTLRTIKSGFSIKPGQQKRFSTGTPLSC